MFGPFNRRCRNRAGLTLLELVVVMAILIAIAAILVPLLPDMMNSGNQATGATNMTELEKALMTFRSTYFRAPNHFDSLLTEDGAAISDLLPGPPGGSYGGDLRVGTLTSAQRKCLSTTGINMVYDLENELVDRADFHPTYSPWVASQPYGSGRTLGEGAGVLMLQKPYGEDRLLGVRLNENHDYVVLGIGSRCNLCGADGLVKEAPIFHYPKAYGKSVPSNSYLRYCAVYDVGDPSATSTASDAKFIGCVAITTGGISTAGSLTKAYLDHQFDMAQPEE
jgi:type II secretory pathway pseudopilin PulG